MFEQFVPLTEDQGHRKSRTMTAPRLMNLMLARAGYPPIAVRPEDRPAYVAAIEIAQQGRGHALFDALFFDRLDRTPDIYLAAAREAKGS